MFASPGAFQKVSSKQVIPPAPAEKTLFSCEPLFVGGEVVLYGEEVLLECEEVSVLYSLSPTFFSSQAFLSSSGTPEMPVDETTRLDSVSPSVSYVGKATVGSLESSPSWKISKITVVDNDIEILWAAGSSSYTNVWADRLSLSYS